jgi:glutathione S-transferase
MITVHHLNNSRSQRVLFALEELDLPYEIVRHERDKKTMLAPPGLLSVHPLGKSPVIVDEGRTIAESGAILEYLVEKYGGDKLVVPAGDEDRLRYRYWMHYAEGSLMPILVMKLVTDRLKTAKMPFFVKPIAKKISDQIAGMLVTPHIPRHLGYIEAELQKSEWLAGDRFSAADIQMSYPLEAAIARGGAAQYPRIKALVDKLHARPAYQRGLERGGPFQLG